MDKKSKTTIRKIDKRTPAKPGVSTGDEADLNALFEELTAKQLRELIRKAREEVDGKAAKARTTKSSRRTTQKMRTRAAE